MFRLLRVLRQRLQSLTRKEQLDEALSDELAFHFDQLVAEHIAEGMSPSEAQTSARRALGNIALLEEQCRDHRRVGWIHDFGQDLRFGARMLRKHPGFTAIAALSLAVGVGANTAVLAVARSVMTQPLHVPDGDRVMVVKTFSAADPATLNNGSPLEFRSWRYDSHVFQGMAASLRQSKDLSKEGSTKVERMGGQGVSPEFFSTVGVQPMLGRVFTADEDLMDHPAPVMILSYDLWQSRFDSDRNVVGTQVLLAGVPTEIIGVMPQGFDYPGENSSFWTPFPWSRFLLASAGRNTIVTARLQPAVSKNQAQHEMERLEADFVRDHPGRDNDRAVKVVSLREHWFGWTKEPLLTIEAAVGMLLLIACANVAGLLLARGSARKSELAMRLALGAGRGRIIRQLLTESVLLSLIGGVLAVPIAWAALWDIPSISPPIGMPRLIPIQVDWAVLAVMAMVSIVTGLIFGVTPALAASKFDLARAVQEAARGAGTAKSQHRVREILVAGQIALALVSLVGAGLLINSFLHLNGYDMNFDPEGVLTFQVNIPPALYSKPAGEYHGVPYADIESPPPSQTFQRIQQRLSTLPAIDSVAGASAPPVNNLLSISVNFSREDAGEAASMQAIYFLATPGFFTTMKAKMVGGRDFNDHDDASGEWVAVINETAARRCWAGENPIGKRVVLDTVPDEQPRRIVGIVHDIPVRRIDTSPQPVIYTSYLQQPFQIRVNANVAGSMTFLLRTSGDPRNLLPGARSVVNEVVPGSALANIQTMNQYVGGRMREKRDYGLVFGVFAFVATALAAIGVYGVISYSVAQRTREIGVRMALGATAGQVLRLMVGRSLMVIAAGLSLGLGGAFALAKVIAPQLWGVTATDPATFISVSVLLGGVALFACLVPAKRAIRVDPAIALRSE